MWTYNQSNGTLIYGGAVIATGYSGHGDAKNDPAMERKVNEGPIPRGRYEIGPVFDSESHGPMCMRLTPLPGTETFGRGGFLIHGDSRTAPGTASHGCVILPRPTRRQIAASEDKELEVV